MNLAKISLSNLTFRFLGATPSMSWSCTYLPGKSHEVITKDALCIVRDLDEAGTFALTLKKQYMAELTYVIDTIYKTDNLKSKYSPSPSLEVAGETKMMWSPLNQSRRQRRILCTIPI